MIAKILILTLIIVGISVSTASPLTGKEDVSSSQEQEGVLEGELTTSESENQGNGSSHNSSIDAQAFSPVNGHLKIYVKYARELTDTDESWNLPDPYVVVDAYDKWLHKNSRSTRTMNETQNPDWNEWLDFGKEDWLEFRIQVWDEDKYWDDQMMPPDTVSVYSGSHYDQIYSSEDNGYLVYDYILE